MKAQILADFIIEYSILDEESISESPKNIEKDFCWVLHVDGTSNSKENGADLILTSPKDIITEHTLRFNFNTSNNEAEYEAFIAKLKLAKELDIRRLKDFTDSQLIVG